MLQRPPHPVQAQFLALAAPPDEQHAECLRRFFASGFATVAPSEVLCDTHQGPLGPREQRKRDRGRRKSESATRAKVIRSYGFFPIFAFLIPALLSAVIEWAFKAFFNWLWNESAAQDVRSCCAYYGGGQ